jgi:hypothetical protein
MKKVLPLYISAVQKRSARKTRRKRKMDMGHLRGLEM